jgi:hypothetical protein
VELPFTLMRRRTECLLSAMMTAGLGVTGLYVRDLANARARVANRSLAHIVREALASLKAGRE